MRNWIVFFLFAAAAFGQNFDTSNNAALKGNYFVREVMINGQNANGTITTSRSAMGTITFDGAGNFQFIGTPANVSGTYGAGANGFLYITSLLDSTQDAYGTLSGVGPSAFVASATEGGTADMMVAIPAGTTASAASLKGNYTAGYVSFPNADVTLVREASFTFTADGAGNLSNVAVAGSALNLGGTAVTQSIPGATYTLTGSGTGTLNLGTVSSSQVLSGSTTMYLSADGNIFIAGTPGGYDLIVGTPAFSGTASNSSWNGIYLTGALEDSISGSSHAIDAWYGSWNANGAGVSVAHDRFNQLQPAQLFDYTFDTQTAAGANGTFAASDTPYKFSLGAGGKVFIGVGTQSLYSMVVGFAAPAYSGSGVYLNPLGVVNAASFAPITNPIAPGEIVALFGSGLAAGTATASALPLPTTLGNVQVKINGQLAPLYYVTPTQIAVLVPQAITPASNIFNATVQVFNNGTASNAVTVYTNYTSPGVFSSGRNGVGAAAAQLSNYTLISSSNPAKVGSTILLYASGLGSVSPPVADGAAAPSNPPATSQDQDQVFIGGTGADIVFNGLTPTLAGLYQLNATLGAGTPTGGDFADISTPDAYTSETTVAVTGSGATQARAEALKAFTAGNADAKKRILPLRRR